VHAEIAMKLVTPLVVVALAIGCASAPKGVAETPAPMPAAPVPVEEAPAPQAEIAAAVDEDTADEPSALPSACIETSDRNDKRLCMPNAEFAKRLCSGVFPEVALTLFAKDQPWSRAYLTGDYEAWNASGGKATRARLAFDEEVLVVAHRPARAGGIVMTGAGATYDVLRWDGTCVSLEANEMTFKRPPAPKAAPIPWRRLGEATRMALLGAPNVQASQKAVEKECTGSAPVAAKSNGAKTAPTKCDRADAAFDKAIVDYVRTGGSLPAPTRRP
jgi:hypothetical protein